MRLEFLIVIEDDRENIVEALKSNRPDIKEKTIDDLLQPESVLEYNDLGDAYKHTHECELVSVEE